MERRINPLPELVGDEPEARHGDFLDSLMATIEYASRSSKPLNKTHIERDFNKFDRKEKIAFDKAYPPEEIEKFINAGEDAPDPIEIFTALKQFDFPDTKPETRHIVLAHFSESRFAPQIFMQDGENNQVLIYRKNIVPLLRASQEVFWRIFDLFTDDVKEDINKIMSRRLENSDRDWQK